jgi:hypothetical protein
LRTSPNEKKFCDTLRRTAPFGAPPCAATLQHFFLHLVLDLFDLFHLFCSGGV